MQTLLTILTIFSSFLANLEQRTLQSDFTVTVAQSANSPLNYPGTITMHGQQFLLNMLGMEAAYDGKTMYMYSAETDELTLSNPTEQELVEANPFLYARSVAGNSQITEQPSADGTETRITLITSTPLPVGQRTGEKTTIVLQVRNSDLMPLEIEIREATTTSTLRLANPGFIVSEPQYIITPAASTFVNDMRF